MSRSLTDALLSTALLSALWLLWSGKFEPFLLELGVASVIFTVIFSIHLGVIDHEIHPFRFGWRVLSYAPWLLWQIVLANLDVTKRILSPSMPISPTLARVTATQASALGRVIYANSITITPGTISVDLQGDQILVHALSRGGFDDVEAGEMNRKVHWLEGG